MSKNKTGTVKPQTLEKRAATRNSLFRLFFVALIVVTEIVLMLYLIFMFHQRYTWIATIARVLGAFLVLGIYSRDQTPSFKMPWIMVIMLNPLIGTFVYLMVGLSGATRRMKRRYEAVDKKLLPMIKKEKSCVEELFNKAPAVGNMARYLEDKAGFPLYDDSDVVFYPDAKSALEDQVREMKKAKKFIFLEYHAIEDKLAFSEIKDVLADKAAEGVDVRVFYDDMGSISFISGQFIDIMKELGIKCRAFNPVTPIVNFFLNNRDHRKITVIDGRVGFTGGYNLADEYFNITHPYGVWKDTGIKITGNAVKNLTMMFLEMWNAIREEDADDYSYEEFFPDVMHKQKEEGSYVVPYGDSPLNNERVGENVYMNIIGSAERYVWFTTPYLIISDEMNNALTLASERGVDVRIVTPGIPDKRTVYSVTRSYYQRLAKRGVKIYEYTAGFVHAKQCVSDDRLATCGTINLDFRSLYHHFENGCLMYNCGAVTDIRADFEALFAECRDVTEKYKAGVNPIKRFWYHVLRLFSAML